MRSSGECENTVNGEPNTFFPASDFVLIHGMTAAMGEADVNKAHFKLLGDIAPVANDVSAFAFGFAEAIFKTDAGSSLAGAEVNAKHRPKPKQYSASIGTWPPMVPPHAASGQVTIGLHFIL